MADVEKPVRKRTLTPEQIEKLKIARLKAADIKRKNKELDNYEKNKVRIERERKRDEVINKIIEERKAKEPPPPPEPIKEDKKEELPPEPEPEPPKETTNPPPPPPKEFIRRQRIVKPKEPTEQELYSNASVAMLRQKLYEQTRKRLVNELFNY